MPHKLENVIKDLIKTTAFTTQTALVDALKEKGITTKQSTVSRALHRLGAVKAIRRDGQLGYQVALPDFNAPNGYQNGLVHRITYNETMVMIHTRAGSASHIAQYLDEQKFSDIMGTIAGDNCILVLPTSVKILSSLVQRLKTFFPKASIV